MDPSASLCLSYDSLKEQFVSSLYEPEWYSQSTPVQLTPKYDLIHVNESPKPLFGNSSKYEILQKVKDAFDVEGFIQARDATNPFEKIGRSIFINRAAVKLANIDAVHHVTKQIFTFDNKSTDAPFKFCDVAAGPGGFTQYLQYRLPKSIGYGMTLKHEKLDWSTKFLDMKRFIPFYGPDNSGNLYTNYDNFVKFVLEKEPSGVDLVTADGGFDLDDSTDKTLLHRQEFLSSRLLLTQAVIGIGCTKIGGNFVVKVFDTVTNISANIIYVLAQCFKQILLFKPITSRPANAERYLICIDRVPNIQEYYQLLVGAARSYSDTNYLNTIFNETLSQEFIRWLTKSNNDSIDNQLQAAQNILLYLKGRDVSLPVYDINKFLIIWNLPDTPYKPPRTK